MPVFHCRQTVSFGDCDPAGIVYYPNIYRWMDASFHAWLREFGGHAALCARHGAIGIGLMEASAQFRTPLRDGDELLISLDVAEWRRKSIEIRYEGKVADRLAFTGIEVRAMFVPVEGGIRAGTLEALRAEIGGSAG